VTFIGLRMKIIIGVAPIYLKPLQVPVAIFTETNPFPPMEKETSLSLTKLIRIMCSAIVNNNSFDARPLYRNLKQRVPNESQRLDAIIKIIDDEYHSNYLFILSKLSTFDGSHSK
jgi:hypothetical protein